MPPLARYGQRGFLPCIIRNIEVPAKLLAVDLLNCIPWGLLSASRPMAVSAANASRSNSTKDTFEDLTSLGSAGFSGSIPLSPPSNCHLLFASKGSGIISTWIKRALPDAAYVVVLSNPP